MSLVKFRANNHPQQTNVRGALDAVDDRGTAPEDFARFDEIFGPFTLDAAASARNAKCQRFYTIDDDALSQDWDSPRVWCNPPYSNLDKWVQKAQSEYDKCNTDAIVMLLPANRCEQKWWQKNVEPYRDRTGSHLHTIFLSGRMRFIKPGCESIGPNERPPFGCVLLIWDAQFNRAMVDL